MNRIEAIDRLRKSAPVFQRAGSNISICLARLFVMKRVRILTWICSSIANAKILVFDLIDVKELAAQVLGAPTDMVPRNGLHRVCAGVSKRPPCKFLMAEKSSEPALQDIVNAIERIRSKTESISFTEFEGDGNVCG